MKMPHATEKPVRKVRSLLRRTEVQISSSSSLIAFRGPFR
jgi:hypothetical protein